MLTLVSSPEDGRQIVSVTLEAGRQATDTIFLNEVLEHLKKEKRGLSLREKMARIPNTERKVAILTLAILKSGNEKVVLWKNGTKTALLQEFFKKNLLAKRIGDSGSVFPKEITLTAEPPRKLIEGLLDRFKRKR